MSSMVMESNPDSLMAATRSLDTILEVVRHMQFYVAPWQDVRLDHEAALAICSAIGSTDAPAFRRLLELDPIIGSLVKEAFDSVEESKLIAIAKDFDLTHSSHLAPTLTVALRSLAKSSRAHLAFVS